MFETLTVVLPIFIIIAMGFGTAKAGLLGPSVSEGLSNYVFVIAIPVLLFRTMATAAIPEAQPWFYWLAYFSILAIIWTSASWIAQRAFRLSGHALPILGFAASQSNTVFIGIPLILSAFGEAGSVPMFLLIAVHLPVTMTAATMMVERADPSERILWGIVKKLAKHPILIGIFCGVAFRLSGLSLPTPLDNATKLMAGSAAATALFALGMTLCRYGFSAPAPLVASIAFLKLIVQPALVYVLVFHVLPMPPVWAAVAVLFAACPTGVNSYLLAERYKVCVPLVSTTIAVTTVAAVVTTTGWLWLVSNVR
jgi:malonate transporter and related proteins